MIQFTNQFTNEFVNFKPFLMTVMLVKKSYFNHNISFLALAYVKHTVLKFHSFQKLPEALRNFTKKLSPLAKKEVSEPYCMPPSSVRILHVRSNVNRLAMIPPTQIGGQVCTINILVRSCLVCSSTSTTNWKKLQNIKIN